MVIKMINFKMIGQRIKNYRVKNNLTQERLAEKLNISVEYMSRVENGNCRVSYSLVEKMSGIFGVDEAEILFGKRGEYDSARVVTEKISSLSKDQRDVLCKLIDMLSEK